MVGEIFLQKITKFEADYPHPIRGGEFMSKVQLLSICNLDNRNLH